MRDLILRRDPERIVPQELGSAGEALYSAAESGALRLAPSVQLLAGPQQAGQVLLLPRERLAVPRVAGLGLAEGARVVDRAPGAVGDAAQVVVEHLVVNDALEEVARHLAPVEHGMDADEGEHRVVAAEGEAAAAGAAAPPAPPHPHRAAPPPDARRARRVY